MVEQNRLKRAYTGIRSAREALVFMAPEQLKIESDKFYIDLEDGGNTVSCTIPIALKKYT